VDEIELIQRVLTRLNLPDAKVYKALARVRDARREGGTNLIAAAFRELLKTFLAAVNQGLQSPTAEVESLGAPESPAPTTQRPDPA